MPLRKRHADPLCINYIGTSANTDERRGLVYIHPQLFCYLCGGIIIYYNTCTGGARSHNHLYREYKIFRNHIALQLNLWLNILYHKNVIMSK